MATLIKMDPLDNNNEEKTVDVPKYFEPELIVNNGVKVGLFRRLGIFLLYWNNGKYELSNRKLLLYYFLWYLGGGIILASAFAIKEIFKSYIYGSKDDYDNNHDKINDLIEASFVGIAAGVLPACGIYLLKEYNTHLPRILIVIGKFEKTWLYKKLKKPDFLNDSKIFFRDGFFNNSYDDKDDEINIESGLQKFKKEKWFIVKYGPLVGVALSFLICLILVITGISQSNIKDSWMKELPYFIIAIFYPFKAYTSLWFCMFFLEWQRKVYASIRKFIRIIRKDSGRNLRHDLELVTDSLRILQKAFLLLNKKIFQKTIVIDFSMFIFAGVCITWKIIQDPNNFVYIFPLGVILVHIYIICKWSNDLMSEHNETIEVLDEMPSKDVEVLRAQLQNAPPQVRAFGGFKASYSMMTAMIAFMLSIISITGMIWPDHMTEECYHYQYKDKENLTLCLNDKISDRFVNGSLLLKQIDDNSTKPS